MTTTELHNPRFISETDKVYCCLLDDSVFYSYTKPGKLLKVEDTIFIFKNYKTHGTSRPLKVVIEMGKHSTMDKQSREFLQEHEVKAICEAVIINGLAQRLLINFYHKLKRHAHPSKVFSSRNEALVWVNSFE